MAVTFVGQATGTTSCTIPAHQAGDLILIFAFRDGATTPLVVPSPFRATGIRAGTSCYGVVGYLIAGSSSEVSGTWTDATAIVCYVCRSDNGGVVPGAFNGASGSTNTSVGTSVSKGGWANSWYALFEGHRSTDTSLQTPAAAYTNRANAVVGGLAEVSAHDTTHAAAAALASGARNITGTASGWISICVELRETPPYVVTLVDGPTTIINAAASVNDAIVPVSFLTRTNDILLLIIESLTVSATPAGWNLISAQTNTNGTATTHMRACWKLAGPSEGGTLTITDTGDHTIGVVFTFRGVDQTTPINALLGASSPNSNPAINLPSITTTAANCLVLGAATIPLDSLGTGIFSSIFNSTLTGLREHFDYAHSVGTGGAIFLGGGFLPTAGASGLLQVGSAAPSTLPWAGVVFALAPEIPDVPGTNLDPLKTSSLIALSNANLTATRLAGTPYYATTLSTGSADAEYMYVEVSCLPVWSGYAGIGISNRTLADSPSDGSTNWLGWDANSIGLYDTQIWYNNAHIGSLATAPAATDVIGVSVWRGDATNPQQVWFKNVTKGEAWVPATPSGFDISSLGTGPLFFGFSLANIPPLEVRKVNFAGPFAIDPAAIVGSTTWDGTPIASAGYTMPAAAGALTLTGLAPVLARTRIMAADTGARVFGFVDGILKRGYKLASEAGAVLLTGVAAELSRTVVLVYTMAASTGAFALAGAVVGTLRTRVLEAAQGAVTLTGQAANLVRKHIMAAAQGAIVLTGYAAGLVTIGVKVLLASTGALLLAGTATGVQYARRMPAAPGALSFVGNATNLIFGAARWLIAEIGALLLTGKAAGLIHAVPLRYTMSAAPGGFVLSQNQAALIAMLREKQPGPLVFGRRLVVIPGRW